MTTHLKSPSVVDWNYIDAIALTNAAIHGDILTCENIIDYGVSQQAIECAFYDSVCHNEWRSIEYFCRIGNLSRKILEDGLEEARVSGYTTICDLLVAQLNNF